MGITDVVGPYDFAGIAYTSEDVKTRVSISINGNDGFKLSRIEKTAPNSITRNKGATVKNKFTLKECVTYTVSVTATGFTPLNKVFIFNPKGDCSD